VSPVATPALALAAGLIIALAPGNPWTERTGAAASRLLQASVVMLGFGLSLEQLASTGARGIAYTAVSIVGVFALGRALGRLFGVERDVSMLITTGTSICGGSAIAAMAPAIGAGREAMAMALATVFVLNAVALYVFPPIGVALGLTQHQFGLWVAMAIHDTSSVVGAASMFGAQALQDATILKLARALWILPLVLVVSGSMRGRGGSSRRLPVPWFVAGFVLAALVRSVEPFESGETLDGLAMLGRRLLVLSLFAVGASLSLTQLRQIGVRPFGQGVVLWLLVSALTLAAILLGASV
jgi:uncharacterized integral membrane protein (TIGR00698 family)